MPKKNKAGRADAATGAKQAGYAPGRKTGAGPAAIVEEDHGRYRIRAGQLAGTFVARAFPKPPTRAQGLIAEAQGDTEQAAIAALKEVIALRDRHLMDARRWDDRISVSVPGEAEYVEALCQVPLTPAQLGMLKAHSVAGEQGMTLDQLTRAAGLKSREAARKAFRSAGELVADYLGIVVGAEADRDRAPLALAFSSDLSEDVTAVWTMHQELRSAVRATL